MLAFACAFTMFAGAAFTDQADINADNAEAVDLLTTLGIIKGYEDGSFDPEGTVDRAEMAKMIYTIRNGGNDNASAHVGNTTSFTDISGHWAEGYIKYLQNTGIVAGKSATQFAPDAQVTTAEAMKMALALAGYDEKNAGLTGIDWQKNTLTYATTIGLTDDVNSAMSAGCTRQDAAQILANALGATAVRYSAVVENFVNDSKSGLSFGGDPISVGRKWMDLWTSIGTLVKIDGQDLSIYPSQSDEADSDKDDGVVIKDFIRVGTDYSDLMGQKVKVLFEDGKNNSVIGVYAVPDNEVIVVNKNDVTADGARVRINDVSYSLSDELRVSIDGDEQTKHAYTSSDFEDAASANVLSFIDSDDDNKIDYVYEKTVTVAKVTYASSAQVVAGGETYRYADHNIAEDVAKDNWVIITKNLYNDNNDIVVAEMNEGSVEAFRNNSDPKEYRIGGEWYNAGRTADNADISASVREGVDVEYVAVNGILFYANRITGSDALQDVLFVMSSTQSGTHAEVMFPNGATDEIRVSDSSVAGWSEGNFYEYTQSGSTYRLAEINLEEGAYGDYSAITNADEDDMLTGDGAVDFTANDGTGKITKYGNYNIDDSADVIVYANDPGVLRAKHITGKQLKALTESMTVNGTDVNILADDDAFGGFYSEIKGGDKATVIAIKSPIGDADTFIDAFDDMTTFANYGFITGVVGRVNGTVQFYMWNGTDNVLVDSDSNDSALLVQGAVVGYDDVITNDDGSYTLVNATAVKATPGYIGWTDGTDFALYPHDSTNAVTEDTVSDFGTVLYVNTANTEEIDGYDCFIGVADGEVVSSADDDKGLVNALYVNDDLLIVDVTGAMNGKNADVVSKTTYNDVNLSKVDGNLFRSFQLVNRYTGETYGEDFVAYDSEYEIQFVAKADGVLYVDYNAADGTDDQDRAIPFSAGDNTDNNSTKIYIPVDNNVTVWTGTAAIEEPTGEGTILLDVKSGSATYDTANSGNPFVIEMVAQDTKHKAGYAELSVWTEKTGGVDVTDDFDTVNSDLRKLVEKAGSTATTLNLVTKKDTEAGDYWVQVEFDGVSDRIMITVNPEEITLITVDTLTNRPAAGDSEEVVLNKLANTIFATPTDCESTIEWDIDGLHKPVVSSDEMEYTITITPDKNHVLASSFTGASVNAAALAGQTGNSIDKVSVVNGSVVITFTYTVQ